MVASMTKGDAEVVADHFVCAGEASFSGEIDAVSDDQIDVQFAQALNIRRLAR
jgi:hypothetical protein